MVHFYTPWKRQKSFGFLTFSGGIEMEYCTKMGQKEREKQIKICYMEMKYWLKDHWAETNFFEKGYIL